MQSEARLIEYRTVSQSSRAEHEASRSRFIGRCFPVSSDAEATAVLERLRKEEWDARHHCYAYRVGATASTARYSDDGEPSGTAGMPIMHVLQQQQLTDVLCVVTRYFGGILLGTGGLVRAYTKSCQDAVVKAGVAVVTPCAWYRLRVAYPLWDQVQPFVANCGILDLVEYTDVVTCTLHVRHSNRDTFLNNLMEKTDARVTAQWEKDGYAAFTVSEVMEQ